MSIHIIVIEIPIEFSLTLLLQMSEERLLHLVEEIEAHENIGIVVQGDGSFLHHIPIQHTLVCQLLVSESLPEAMIDIGKVLPQFQEPLFEF